MTDKPQSPEESPVVRRRPETPENPEVTEAPEAPEAAVEPEAAEAPAAAPAQGLSRRVVDVGAERDRPAPSPAPQPVAAEPEPVDDDLDAQFGALMAMGGSSTPEKVHFEEGQKITGRVAHIGQDNVFLNIGGKTEGFIARSELLNADEELTVNIGDELEVYVAGFRPGGVELTRGLAKASDAHRALAAAFDNKVPVEGKVVSRNKGGFEVTVMGERAFCPISQIEMAYTEDADAHLGQTYRFLVTRYEEKGRNIDVVLSRAELERQERAEAQESTFKTLEVNQVRTGRVRKLMPFGAFVDLGGVDGLIHVSELSWHRIDDPAEVVKPGQEVKVKILDLRNMEAGPDKARISLSLRAAEGNPWDDVSERYQPGTTCNGEVVRLEQYGAFIQLEPGIDGLVHVSELSLGRVRHPSDVVEVGQKVTVQILSVDLNRQRISLSVKALEADPWESASERYAEGTEVTGTVENIEPFGVFVSLEPGITALIPQSELATERGRDPSLDFRVGQQVTARVLSLDSVRQRLSLTRRDPEEARSAREEASEARPSGNGRPPRRERKPAEPTQWKDTSGGKGSGMGTLADLFPAKLRRMRNKD